MNIHRFLFQVLEMNLKLGVLCLLGVVWCNAATEEKNKDVGTVVGIDLGTTYSW